MMNNKAFKVEFETQDRKNLKVVIDNNKEFTIYNHKDFPIEKPAVQALKKELAKEMRKAFKHYNNKGAMLTVSILDSEYNTIPLYRFTFENSHNGKPQKFVEHRPIQNNEFNVSHTNLLDEAAAIRDVNGTIEELVHQWFTVYDFSGEA